MNKTLVAAIGILVLASALFLNSTVQNGEKKAAALNNTKKVFGMISDDAPPPCVWDVQPPEKVMSEDKTQSVVVRFKNPEKKPCETYLSLRAPNFDTTPSKEELKISVPPGKTGSVSWILIPRKTGTYELAISDILNTSIYGITVTNIFGLNASQAKILSMLGSLFGPMLTIPWWVDKWFQRKKKQEPKKEDNGNKSE